MDSVNDTHCWVGCPIRISTDQSLLAAPHGFSQRATSFIASWCQGIHRMPFLCSISTPGLTREPPCTETILRPGSPTGLDTAPVARGRPHAGQILAHHSCKSSHTAHNSSVPFASMPTIHARPASKEARPHDRRHITDDTLFTTPLNPRHPTAGVQSPRTPEGAKGRFPGQTCNRTAGHPPGQTARHTSHASRDAPEPDSP